MTKDKGVRAGHSGKPQAPAGLGHSASVPDAALWPVYEFRPLPQHTGSIVFRYADGQWLPDDGEWDVAFVSYGGIAPLGLYVDLPYQRNIIWAGLTSHWSQNVATHPRGNPWHYMLRDGETEWGGSWERDRHINERAGRAAMDRCCSLNGAANGRGPEFKIDDPYIQAGLLRERESKRVAVEPERLTCMYCGDEWHHSASATEARRAETGTGSVHEGAAPKGETP